MMSDRCCISKETEIARLARQLEQRGVLFVVLAINAAMFVVEFGTGVIAGSAALMADSVDMFGDALVYGLSLYALARSSRWKAGAALAKGLFILIFGLAIVVDITIKIRNGVAPSSGLMMLMGAGALVANLVCLRLLWRFQSLDVNMASTFECSRNDVISNVGVLIAAAAVAITRSPWPDIVVGAIIAALFLRSAIGVIGSSVPELRRA